MVGSNTHRAAGIAVAAMFAAVFPLLAQSPTATPAPATPPCTSSPQPQPCTAPRPAAGQGSPAERFPFPGQPPAGTNSAPSTPGGATTLDTPPSSKRFPFPGDDPTSAGSSSPSSSGSVNSSSSSSSSTDPASAADTDPTSPAAGDKPPSGRRLLKRINPQGTKLQSPEEREGEDLDIAQYYLQTGNAQAAYLRSQDAVKLAPADADAHCSLGEAALKLNKRDEANTEFNACLKLDPDEKLAKNARKQLAKLK